MPNHSPLDLDKIDRLTRPLPKGAVPNCCNSKMLKSKKAKGTFVCLKCKSKVVADV